MKIRLGYVAIALRLPKVTSSSTVTYKTYSKITSKEERIRKLKTVTLSNLEDLKKILRYNIKNEIHFYRITSKLIPLATHPDVDDWNYRKIFEVEFKELSELIKSNYMRVDTHPDQFNVINSIKKEVLVSTERNLWYHANFFKDIDYELGKMVIHIGGATGGKTVATERFVENFNKLPREITSRLILENDDKTFTAREVLNICKRLSVPMVLDIHHHNVHNNGEKIEDMLQEILDTWKDEKLPPKMHFSTPKEFELDKKHSDYIDGDAFVEFIELLKEFDTDVDIMLEAKQKDLTLYDLVTKIKNLKPDYIWSDKSTFEVNK